MESKSDLIFSIADTMHLYRKRRNRRQAARSKSQNEPNEIIKAHQRQELHQLLHENTGLIASDGRTHQA
jgi:hypothetical protein